MGSGSFPACSLPALQPQIPQLHCSLPSLKSIIRAINPTGLSHLFVVFLLLFLFCFFKLRTLPIVSSSLILFARLAAALGVCVVIFLIFILSTDLIKFLLISWSCQVYWPHQGFPVLSSYKTTAAASHLRPRKWAEKNLLWKLSLTLWKQKTGRKNDLPNFSRCF